MLRHRINAVTGAGLVALLTLVSASAAPAQDRKLEDLLNKIERLERDIRVINRQVVRSSAAPARAASPSRCLQLHHPRGLSQRPARRPAAPAE